MTKRREPLTFHHALTKVAALLGYDECGAICGVSERAVRSWSDPDDAREITLGDALRLDRAFLAAGGDQAPFHRVYSLRLEVAKREADACLIVLAAGAAKEGGEAVSAMLRAAQNPHDPVARREARREGEEAIAAITDGLAALDRQEQANAAGAGG
jgi:hypothetical protein